MKKTAILFSLLCISIKLLAQGTFSGDLMMNVNFFQSDPSIKASGNPLYDNYLSGSESWLDLRYSVSGFTFFARADAFNNSNLKDPTSANTAYGIGAWSINKDMKDLNITVGYIYDQVGSGILFRSYEDRGLLIDNALVGVELKYNLTHNVMLKAFGGQQKDNENGQPTNSLYAPVIKGFNAEGDFSAGKVHIIPGVGVLNRTLDGGPGGSYAKELARITAFTNPSQIFTPVYNMYAFAAYNTLTYKNLSWYIEGDYKTKEGINDSTSLINKPGNVEYTSVNYGKKGIALSLTGKRTEDFVMSTSPSQTLLNGMLDWQPIVAVLRPERLMSRYTPASQNLSEMAGTANLILSPNDATTFNLTYTHINTLQNQELYREAFIDGSYLGIDKWIFAGGIQYMEYNISLYQVRAPDGAPILYAITPFTEITYRFSERKSVRMELQYMDTKQDYGSWVYALLEYDFAPKWSLSVYDMYNTVVNRNPDNPNFKDANFANEKGLNYPTAYAAYTKGPHRFSLAYVKQVDGINCSGGVCRYEPAFSGVKATLTTSF